MASQKQLTINAESSSLANTSSSYLQRQCGCGQHTLGGECAECKKKGGKEMIQRRASLSAVPGAVAPIGQSILSLPGESLNENARAFLKPQIGLDFSGVRTNGKRIDSLGIQPKLTVSRTGDKYEQEADRLAEEIVRMPETKAQKSKLSRPTQSTVQRRDCGWSADHVQAPSIVSDALHTPGRPLDREMRAFMEPRFGYDFSSIQIHTGARAEDAARSLHARAFTLGRNVVFGAGEYDPQSERGRNLLAHELTHTLQQDGGSELRRKPLTAEEKQEDLQSPRLKDDSRLQQAFDNSPLLKKNETSDGVKTLQRALKDLGYSLPISFKKTGDADGIFGDETESQVKQFQRDNHISDDGIVGRDTLRALDSKFNAMVSIESVFFSQDRKELVANETDWSATGAKYADWAGAPYHIQFGPGGMFDVQSIPITLTAGQQIAAIAKVNLRGGVPGSVYSVKATPQGSVPGWTLTGEGIRQSGVDSDFISLSGSAPLSDKIAFQDFLLLWEAEADGAKSPGALSSQKVFVTSGPAHNTAESNGVDTPNIPTFRRLTQAVKYARDISATQADRIVYEVFSRFPRYGVCDVPTVPNPYGFTCPVLSSVWEMADFERSGNFQCITISRYVNAVLNVLGVPGAVASLVAKAVVIWADPGNTEKGLENDYPHPGIGIPSIVHPRHPDWALGLIDGRCGINNYEACVKLEWTPPGQSNTVVQYYCGGLGTHNPVEGFKTPREVLNSAFVLAYFVRMARNDPVTGFPRGIRKEDVKVYNESGSCHREL